MEIMAYKVWGVNNLFNKNDLIEFFSGMGIEAGNALSEAERTRKASVNIGGKKVMLFKF